MKSSSACFSIVALGALAACAVPAEPPAVAAPAPVVAKPPEPEFRCAAEPAKFAVGQPHSAQLEAAARHRAGARIVRVMKPGQVATMEVDTARLNLDVDGKGRVTNARCG